MRRLIFFFFLFIVRIATAGDIVKIGLFTGSVYEKINVSVVSGSYLLIGDNKVLFTLTSKEKNIQCIAAENTVQLIQQGKSLGSFKRVTWRSSDAATFQLATPGGQTNSYIYAEDLMVSARSTVLQLINAIHLENYVPGVVEAEAGKGHTETFYKVQSIISRTYALNNLRRHEAEGFQLCDGIHCQVYHGKPLYEPLIDRAAQDTRDLVVVDDNIDLITAAFHSNCGGRTLNAEDVWSKPLAYCTSREDTFCLTMPHSNWEKSISRHRWTRYLESKRYPTSDSATAQALAYFPSEKQVYFVDSTFKIPLKVIRSDLKLRSTFFSIYQNGDDITFTGQGFGHGVGLCQEGAMRMAQLGYAYDEIIHYYYKNVHLVPLHLIWFFKYD